MNRRSFLRRAAIAGATLPLAAGGSPLRAFANGLAASPFARSSTPDGEHVLVILRLDGGNDGLNTLVPYHDDEYYRARRRGLTNDISIHPERAIPLPGSGTLGLHPALAPLQALFNEEKVAIVQNVGYLNTVMSHFRSTEIWMSATDAGEFDATGWMARSFEQAHPEYPSILGDAPYAIEFSTRLSTAFLGHHGDIGMAHTEITYVPPPPGPGTSTGARALAERRHIEAIMRQSGTFSRSILAARERVPDNRVEYPTIFELADGPRFSAQLAETARLIASGLDTRVYLVSLPFYDFHIRQTTREQAQHDTFSRSVVAFQRDLEAFGIDHRVAIVTISEFGRRVESQGSGTDHGGAAPLFVIGTPVRSGFVGHDPNLTNLVGPGNLAMQYDFRQVYASILSQWLGATPEMASASLLGRAFDELPLFRSNVPPNELDDALLGEPWPSPASSHVTIPIGPIAASPSRLTLHTIDGRLIHALAVYPGSGPVVLDVRGLAAGVYLCRIADSDRSAVRRFTVAR